VRLSKALSSEARALEAAQSQLASSLAFI
jgi:hypothetical protein